VISCAALWVGAAVLLAGAVVGLVPLRTATVPVQLAGQRVSWLVPVLGLALVAAAFAYVVALQGFVRAGHRSVRPLEAARALTGLTVLVAAAGVAIPAVVWASAALTWAFDRPAPVAFGGAAGTVVLTYVATLVGVLWRHRKPIGKRVGFDPAQPIEIVGVVGHVKHDGLDAEARTQHLGSHARRQRAHAPGPLSQQGEPCLGIERCEFLGGQGELVSGDAPQLRREAQEQRRVIEPRGSGSRLERRHPAID